MSYAIEGPFFYRVEFQIVAKAIHLVAVYLMSYRAHSEGQNAEGAIRETRKVVEMITRKRPRPCARQWIRRRIGDRAATISCPLVEQITEVDYRNGMLEELHTVAEIVERRHSATSKPHLITPEE